MNLSQTNIIRIDDNKTEKIIIDVYDNNINAQSNVEINVGKGATLTLIFKQNKANTKAIKIGTTINCEANSNINISTINIEPQDIYNNLIINLNGEHSEATLNGIYIINGDGSVTNHTEIHHNAPQCTSNELYKGILNDNAIAHFEGLIKVEPNAQKTVARQTNRHMLLSNNAHGYAQPHLIINADDVKCSHGATCGQLDKEQLFYMQQRGIALETAQRLLTAAFANEVIDLIPDEQIREELYNQISYIE